MAIRGIVSNGVVVLDPPARLPDGTQVEVSPLPPEPTTDRRLPAFGIWKDRTDISDSHAYARDLRVSTEQRDASGRSSGR